MLKFLLVVLCIYFLFRIFLRSFRINMSGQRFDMRNGESPNAGPQRRSEKGDIHVEESGKKPDEPEYSDYEEIK